MYVCICAGANEKTIKDAIVTVHSRTGKIPAVKDIFTEAGCGEGSCRHLCGAQINDMIKEADLTAPSPA